ncbi:hypothetical protein HZ326_23647 [Fusarium oxysporum f. sp. albedinis]|nr:hypothetical protein HZ326_23647 [Fusarium oxysporum f. sp. albedinis]
MVLQDQKCQQVEALFEALKWPGSQAVYVHFTASQWFHGGVNHGMPSERLATSAHQRYTKTGYVGLVSYLVSTRTTVDGRY